MSYLRFLVLAAVSSGCLFAQSNAGQITGTVFDPTKAVMDGVAISAANIATNVTQTATSNKDGVYSLPSLQPGALPGDAREGRLQEAAPGADHGGRRHHRRNSISTWWSAAPPRKSRSTPTCR